MRNKKMTGAALAAMSGGMILAGGCLGSIPWQQIIWGTALYAADEFLLDNDGVFDLFEDGNVTAAEE